eukprot:TRINITY_DN12531_c0_g1_i2.p1 TRINITY_DN12531_c0_g1~~TRINITY_DN12531_c0_g1_i2.p1  ORF type:complete len:548 (+),score=123.32 TRINITY_DN12531_c0_g1_i2:110-1753(+)
MRSSAFGMYPEAEEWPAPSRMADSKLEKGSASKALLRHGLLQPLPQLQRGPPSTLSYCKGSRRGGLDRATSLGELTLPLAPPATSPTAAGGYPESFASQATPAAAEQHRLGAPAASSRPGTSGVSSRPGTSAGNRPGTASRSAAQALTNVAFPPKLGLRISGDASGKVDKRWCSSGEIFVLPLETQGAVQEVSAACAAAKLEVVELARLSVWALHPQEGASQKPGLSDQVRWMEPLAAMRTHALASASASMRGVPASVNPIEMVLERCGTASSSSSSGSLERSTALKYGECFRLRVADSGLYLAHGPQAGGEAQGQLRFERVAPSESAADRRGLRFAAHGGELGKPLLFGRPLSMLRVPSSALSEQSETDSDLSSDSSSESESELLIRGAMLRRRERAAAREAKTQRLRERQREAEEQQQQAVAGCSMLLSRLADGPGPLQLTVLPAEFVANEAVQPAPPQVLQVKGSSDTKQQEEEAEEELQSMDVILTELRRQLKAEAGHEIEQRTAWLKSEQRVAELEAQIAEGEKLKQATMVATGRTDNELLL